MRRNDKNDQSKMTQIHKTKGLINEVLLNIFFHIDKNEIHIGSTRSTRYIFHYFQVSIKGCLTLMYEIGASRKICFDWNLRIIYGDNVDFS